MDTLACLRAAKGMVGLRTIEWCTGFEYSRSGVRALNQVELHPMNTSVPLSVTLDFDSWPSTRIGSRSLLYRNTILGPSARSNSHFPACKCPELPFGGQDPHRFLIGEISPFGNRQYNDKPPRLRLMNGVHGLLRTS